MHVCDKPFVIYYYLHRAWDGLVNEYIYIWSSYYSFGTGSMAEDFGVLDMVATPHLLRAAEKASSYLFGLVVRTFGKLVESV